jgi:hypothetical protein
VTVSGHRAHRTVEIERKGVLYPLTFGQSERLGRPGSARKGQEVRDCTIKGRQILAICEACVGRGGGTLGHERTRANEREGLQDS